MIQTDLLTAIKSFYHKLYRHMKVIPQCKVIDPYNYDSITFWAIYSLNYIFWIFWQDYIQDYTCILYSEKNDAKRSDRGHS